MTSCSRCGDPSDQLTDAGICQWCVADRRSTRRYIVLAMVIIAIVIITVELVVNHLMYGDALCALKKCVQVK